MHKMHKSTIWLSLLVFCWLLIWCQETSFDTNFVDPQQDEDDLIIELRQTTAGIASGSATPDGKPLLWKNRDRGGNARMEFHYRDDLGLPFIGYTDDGNVRESYGGLNAAGFAIGNTDAHNVQNGNHNDGRVQYDALAKCRTVDDFAMLLDSADLVDVNGRYGYNYFVFDAFGGAALFEAHRFGYVRYNADEQRHGFIVRSNYAHSGPAPGNNDQTYGIHRHDRSFALWKAAVENGDLTPIYILQTVARDISIIDKDPYPLPFEGTYQNYPYGSIPNTYAICRATTSAVMVAQGVRRGDDPRDAILWSMIGPPLGGIMSPLWVRSGSVPRPYDSPTGSDLNRRFIEIRNWTYNNQGGVVTTKLHNQHGNAWWDWALNYERFIYNKTKHFIQSDEFHWDRLITFQNEMASQLLDSVNTWKPKWQTVEIASLVYYNNVVRLNWGELNLQERLMFGDPVQYAVYRHNRPFSIEDEGELIAITEEFEYIDHEPLSMSGFYQVRAVFSERN